MKNFKGKFLSDYEKERIISLYKEGFTINEILEEVDLTYGKISDFLNGQGLLKKRKKIDKENEEEVIVKLFNEGRSVREIAFDTLAPTYVIWKILRENGLVKNKYNYAGKNFTSYNAMNIYRQEIKVKVRQDYKDGKTKGEIMKLYNLSSMAVGCILHKNR